MDKNAGNEDQAFFLSPPGYEQRLELSNELRSDGNNTHPGPSATGAAHSCRVISGGAKVEDAGGHVVKNSEDDKAKHYRGRPDPEIHPVLTICQTKNKAEGTALEALSSLDQLKHYPRKDTVNHKEF
eukprot:gb/GECG01016166.1/.p1 GENE.gb/GECG01016166.1/~~gb/GECG01016166.1/.p1  ORF type:complete len:127 (+),score=24.06 gb/GECG01016166.1/:1-381(+)